MSESLFGVEDEVDKELIKDQFAEAAIEEDSTTTAERVKGLIEDCKKLLIPDLESVVGAWGLIDSDPVTGLLAKESLKYIGDLNTEHLKSENI